MLQRYYISIHAPLRERRFGFSCRSDCFSFQSTLPYGSEEFADLPSSVRAISIHAPLRERLPYGSDDRSHVYKTTFNISIHAPLRERPIIEKGKSIIRISIHAPLRERRAANRLFSGILISIHAPLRERLSFTRFMTNNRHFNPRSLTGATFGIVYTSIIRSFQSTLPYGSELLLD